jgi:hypothetical protein
LLLDIVIQSVNAFQADCMTICEKHYPTIHSQGMTEHHLGLAFTRRLARTLIECHHPCDYHPIELSPHNQNLPAHFCISSEIGTIWIITHHMISAGKACRDKLYKSIYAWKEKYKNVIKPCDLLILINDHWMSKTISRMLKT